MKQYRYRILIVLCAFVVVCSMDYDDSVESTKYCESMKESGAWPKGYQCG